MKTKTKLSALFTIIFSLFMLSATTTKLAPCPYKVVNTLGCDVVVDVRILDTTCSAYCATFFNVVIPLGGTYTIPCGACPNVCNVIVSVKKIGSTPMYYDCTFTTGAIALPSICSANQIVFNSGSGMFIIS